MMLAVIPARGGSKRIPRKNIKYFLGEPMIAHSISIARRSGLFKHIIVSTDDPEIVEVAKKYGAEVPFIRPSNLADDYSGTVPVIAHAINECLSLGYHFDWVCCIYPAAPFIKIVDLEETLSLVKKNHSSYCFPVAEYRSPIQRAMRMLPNKRLESFLADFVDNRTQDLEKAYYDAGQFYWARPSTWLKNSNIHNNGLGYLIPGWRAIDIDQVEDWVMAEMFASVILKENE